MIFILSILINLCLIVAVWASHRRRVELFNSFWAHMDWHQGTSSAHQKFIQDMIRREARKMDGAVRSSLVSSKLATKMADRAFNMASTANLGVVALQKALATPRLLTKQQVEQNKLASENVDKLFHQGGTFDWLRPILSDEELEIVENAEKAAKKSMSNGS